MPEAVGIGGRAVVDAAVRLLDQRVERARALERFGVACFERGGGELRRDLAGLRAAHPVGDARRAAARRRSCPRSGAACARCRSRPRMRRRHLALLHDAGRSRRRGGCRPGSIRSAPTTREPLTNVPFVESRSCTQTPSPRTSIRAWRDEANSSPVEHEVVLAAASEGERRGVERELALPSRGSGCAGRRGAPTCACGVAAAEPGFRGCGRREDHAVLARRPAPVSRPRGADDAHDEDVEEHEEGDLEDEEELRRPSRRRWTIGAPIPARSRR